MLDECFVGVSARFERIATEIVAVRNDLRLLREGMGVIRARLG
jgi:aspartate ammonia-lyase